MEEFLSSNGVQYVHHDIATDDPARHELESRGIKSAPVTIIDGQEAIIGYYPKKLIPALNLNVKVDLSGKTAWLSEKYSKILGATMRATQQFTIEQLQRDVSWRPETLRDTIMHILSFPELAYLSHKHGSMNTDDMRACKERLKDVLTPEAITQYGDGVVRGIVEFLGSGDDAAFDREVPAHYGGEVTVVELLNIILSHSTHHLKQVYWFAQNELGVTLKDSATVEDMEGIVTPEKLI